MFTLWFLFGRTAIRLVSRDSVDKVSGFLTLSWISVVTMKCGIICMKCYQQSQIRVLSFTVAAKDLIKGLLKTDPDERLTIEEVLRNKWIAVSSYSVCVLLWAHIMCCTSCRICEIWAYF